MNYKMHSAILDYDGNTCVDADTQEPMTLGACAIRALNTVFKDDEPLSMQEQYERGELCANIAAAMRNGRPLALPPEQLVLIRERVSKLWPSPLISWRVQQLTNGDAYDDAT